MPQILHWVSILFSTTIACWSMVTSQTKDAINDAPKLCVALTLLVLVTNAVVLLFRKRPIQAVIAVIIAVAIFWASLQAWYGRHAIPGPKGYEFHSHSVWDLGHVH